MGALGASVSDPRIRMDPYRIIGGLLDPDLHGQLRIKRKIAATFSIKVKLKLKN